MAGSRGDGDGFPEVEGVLTIREHCLFRWRERGSRRVVEVTSEHCAACVAELRRLGFFLEPTDGPATGGPGSSAG